MDPIANLEEQRRLTAYILDNEDAECEAVQAAAIRLAELCRALDDWRKHGGFDPYTA